MGFDLTGEYADVSAHFNVWCWHPMWYFCYQQGWIDEEQYENGKGNTGFRIDEETTSILKREIILFHRLNNFEEIITNVNKEFNEKVRNEIQEGKKRSPEIVVLQLFGAMKEGEDVYHFTSRHLIDFANFCKNAKTFEIC